jgi:hypothetical protein
VHVKTFGNHRFPTYNSGLRKIKTMPALHEVFGVSASIPKYTYVDRSGLDNRFRYSLQRDSHVVLHGGSKQGKTVLRRANLPEEKSVVVQCRATTTCTQIYEQILADIGASLPVNTAVTSSTSGEVGTKASASAGLPLFRAKAEVSATANVGTDTTSTSQAIGGGIEDLSFVSKAIQKSGRRPIVEDFHYMPEEEKRKLSFDLKAFWDMRTFFIIVGIWAEQNLLPYYNGDLSGRIDEIDVQWTSDELGQVLSQGEAALKIIIAPEIRSQMIADGNQNVGLLQRIAEKFCIHSGIFATSESAIAATLADQAALDRCRSEICSEEASRYRQFADALSRGFKSNEESELKVYQNIARVSIEAPDHDLRDGLHYDTMYERVSLLNDRVRRSDLTAALQRLNRLQQDRQVSPLVLSYNEKSRYVQLVDRELLFYRKYGNPVWPWMENGNGDGLRNR